MSRLVLPSMDNLAAPVAVPMETISPAAVRRTIEPSSVNPETFKSAPTPATVSFLSEVEVEMVMPVPAENSSVSVLDPAEKEVLPTLMVLKIFWLEPGSVLSIVRV